MATLPAVRQESSVAPAGLVPQSIDELMQFSEMAVKSRLLPASIQTKEQAAIIAIKGRELGITFMQSFESLYVVYGRVGMETKLMAALFTRAGHQYRIIERTPQRAVVDIYLKGQDEPQRFTMTMEEAVSARWHLEYDKEKKEWRDKNTWKTMPARMLMYRCLSSAIRLIAPGCLFGLHTTDELGDERPEPTVIEQRVQEQIAEAQEAPIEGETTELRDEPVPAPWAQNPDTATKFLNSACDYFGLSYPEVMEALGVDRIEQVTISMVQAKAKISAWVEEQIHGIDEGAEDEPRQGALV